MKLIKGIFSFKQTLFISILSAVLAITGIGILALFFVKKYHKEHSAERGADQES